MNIRWLVVAAAVGWLGCGPQLDAVYSQSTVISACSGRCDPN